MEKLYYKFTEDEMNVNPELFISEYVEKGSPTTCPFQKANNAFIGGIKNFRRFMSESFRNQRNGVDTGFRFGSTYSTIKVCPGVNDLLKNDLNVLVYNFVDMLSHARTEMEVIKELADDESAYRSLTASWFNHSPLKEILKKIAKNGHKLVITTDHGTIRVDSPVKIVGDKHTNTNLRYKVGKNLGYNEKEVLISSDPEAIRLPRENVSSSFVFAKENDFFAYPNNFNYYANYYRDTFQHGGVSLEEVIIPFIELFSIRGSSTT